MATGIAKVLRQAGQGHQDWPVFRLQQQLFLLLRRVATGRLPMFASPFLIRIVKDRSCASWHAGLDAPSQN
jgi:hypothetical protein